MNKTRIKLTAIVEERIGWSGKQLERWLDEMCYLRTARKVGDEEMVGHYALGKLCQYQAMGLIYFDIIK